MILVTAATGQIGGTALRALVAANHEVRALVRDPSASQVPEGAGVVKGDFDDEDSLDRALDGVSVMLMAGRDSPESVAQHRRVLASACRAGVRHIVKLSAIGASANSPVALMREHHEVDEEVRNSPVSWTYLKPHLFMQNLLRAADAVRQDGKLSAPMGQDRFPLVDTRDIGEVAAVVLGDADSHVGKEYILTGPAALSYDDVASETSMVADRRVVYEPVAPKEHERLLLDAGMPGWRAFDLAHIASAYSAADNSPTDDIRKLLGREPRSLARFLADHRQAYAP